MHGSHQSCGSIDRSAEMAVLTFLLTAQQRDSTALVTAADIHATAPDYTQAELNRALAGLVEGRSILEFRTETGTVCYRLAPPESDREPGPAPALDLVHEITSWCANKRRCAVSLTASELGALKGTDRMFALRAAGMVGRRVLAAAEPRASLLMSLLYQDILDLADNENGVCTAAMGRLAESYNRHRNRTQAALTALKKLGLIEVDLRPGCSSEVLPCVPRNWRGIRRPVAMLDVFAPEASAHAGGHAPIPKAKNSVHRKPKPAPRQRAGYGQEVNRNLPSETVQVMGEPALYASAGSGITCTAPEGTTLQTREQTREVPNLSAPPSASSGRGEDEIRDLDFTGPNDAPSRKAPLPPGCARPPSPKKATATGKGKKRPWRAVPQREREDLFDKAIAWTAEERGGVAAGWTEKFLRDRFLAFDNHWKEIPKAHEDWWGKWQNWLLKPDYQPRAPRGGGRPGPVNVASVVAQFIRRDDDEIGGGQ
jgi:hypothetical protein